MLQMAYKNDRTVALESVSEEIPEINKLPEFYLMNGLQMLLSIQLISDDENGIFSIYVVESSFSILRQPTMRICNRHFVHNWTQTVQKFHYCISVDDGFIKLSETYGNEFFFKTQNSETQNSK